MVNNRIFINNLCIYSNNADTDIWSEAKQYIRIIYFRIVQKEGTPGMLYWCTEH